MQKKLASRPRPLTDIPRIQLVFRAIHLLQSWKRRQLADVGVDARGVRSRRHLVQSSSASHGFDAVNLPAWCHCLSSRIWKSLLAVGEWHRTVDLAALFSLRQVLPVPARDDVIGRDSPSTAKLMVLEFTVRGVANKAAVALACFSCLRTRINFSNVRLLSRTWRCRCRCKASRR